MEKFEDLIQGDQLVLVDFFATWCSPCQMMHPILDELKQQTGDKVKILKLDVDVAANRQPVYTYQIQSVPTLMLFRNGKMLCRNSGVVRTTQLKEIVEKYAGTL